MVFSFYLSGLTGVTLPHPEISTAIFLVVEKALCAAWDLMRTQPRPGFDLLAADEDLITHELYERLYDEVFNKRIVDGFDRQLFSSVTRDSKVRNYDGSSLDKMPDILVGLTDRNVFKQSQDWLFVECKPVDNTHSAGVHYCDKGVTRFVSGQYAWAMTSALMVGYARSGYTILPKLTDALQPRADLYTVEFPNPCHRSKPSQYSETVHISSHSRTFSYVETGQHATNIMIRHLWLRRD